MKSRTSTKRLPPPARPDDGTLTYTFVESVKATYPFYAIRLLGGMMFLFGMLLMAYNTLKTVGSGKAVDAPVLAPAHA